MIIRFTKFERLLLLILLLLSFSYLNAQVNFQITEIFPVQKDKDFTAQWFEIYNSESTAWVSGLDSILYDDLESASIIDADPIMGLTNIQPDGYIIEVINDSDKHRYP